jgi:hypothetical protein
MRNVRRVLRRFLVASLAFVPLFSAGGACSKKERQVPPGPPPLPPLHVAASDRNAASRQAQHAMPSDHPALLRSRSEMEADPSAGQPPTLAAPAAQAAGAAVEGSLRGAIRVTDALKTKAAPGSTLFLIARSALDGGGVGPVVAVQRYSVSAWPLPFELTQDNVMLAGTKLSGKVVLMARVDQDGDAMTKQPGDLEGTTAPISVPAQTVELVLDKVRTEAAGAPSPAGMGQPQMPAGHPAMPAGHP